VGFAPAEPPEELHVLRGGEEEHHDADQDQGGADRQRNPRGVPGRRGADGRDLVQEHPEAGHDEAEAHKRQPRTHPGQQRPLASEADAGILRRWLPGALVHRALPWKPAGPALGLPTSPVVGPDQLKSIPSYQGGKPGPKKSVPWTSVTVTRPKSIRSPARKKK